MRTPQFLVLACVAAIAMLPRPGMAQAMLQPPPTQQAGSAEHVQMRSVRIAPFAATTAPGAAPVGPIPGLLNTPQGWARGGAAAIVTWDGRDPAGPRDRLIGALLEAGMEVLELDLATPRGFAADSGRNPPAPTLPELLPDLFGAMAFLRQEEGAGSVVAFGFGEGGAAARLALREAASRPALRAMGLGLAAAGQLGRPGGLTLADPAQQPAGWALQAVLLCRALGQALPATDRPADCANLLQASIGEVR
jgi:hypothetical protein